MSPVPPVDDEPAKVNTCAAEVEAEVGRLWWADKRPVDGPAFDRSGTAAVLAAERDGARLEPASIVSERCRASPSVISSRSSAEVRRGK